jgi:hypothetical protein
VRGLRQSAGYDTSHAIIVYHGLSVFLIWGVLVPVGIIFARYLRFLRASPLLNNGQIPTPNAVQANCRTHRPQKLKCLISLCTNPTRYDSNSVVAVCATSNLVRQLSAGLTQPGNLPVGVAPVGLVGVVAGASIESMGLLPPQKGAVQRFVSQIANHLPVTAFST